MPERSRLNLTLPPPADLAAVPEEEFGRTQPSTVILVLAGGLVITLVLVFLASRLEERAARADFTALAEQRFALVEARVERALDALVAVGGFCDAQPHLSRQQFGELARPILGRQPALRALAWVPYTSGDQLAALRSAVRADGYPEFDFNELANDGGLRPVGPRAEYFPVVYVEPIKGNERAFGLDLGSDPRRYLALDAARREGGMVASSRLYLVEERPQDPGFLVFRPVYARAPHADRGDALSEGAILVPDPAALRGYVLGVFRIAALADVVPADWRGPPMTLYLFDRSGTGEQALYPSEAKATNAAEVAGTLGVQRTIRVGGRNWVMSAVPPEGTLRVDRTATRILLVAGLVLTALLALLQQQVRNRARAIERSVAARTAELHASERRLIQANYEAVQGSRLKTMFLASMSHEFRTPMNAILGLLHVMGRTPLDASQRDHIEKISSAARRLLRLIDDILDVSRMEAGKLSVERQPFALESVLRDVLVAVAPKLRDKPVELVLDLDPTTPAQVVGDAMRLTQVLVNLADNAAKFTQEGEVVMSVESARLADQRIELRVAVRDTGPGLSEEDAATVFQPFVQAASPRQRHPGGTGLGLAICRQLVNLMGGEIGVESRAGVGARFHFVVPLGLAADSPLAEARPSAQTPRVLVLDSNSAAGAALARMARGFGCHAQNANALATAVELLTSQAFEVVLLSEDFAGGGLRERLPPERWPGRSVVLVGIGSSLRGDHREDWVEKPVLPSVLARVLFAQHSHALSHAVVAAPPPVSATLPQAAALVAIEDRPGWLEAAAPVPSVGSPHPLSGEVPAELRALAEPLRTLLQQGDPDAELAARALFDWARDTKDAYAAAELLRQCSNFDFREALAGLEVLCPLAARTEK
jgi:signal transduction histidine kinase